MCWFRNKGASNNRPFIHFPQHFWLTKHMVGVRKWLIFAQWLVTPNRVNASSETLCFSHCASILQRLDYATIASSISQKDTVDFCQLFLCTAYSSWEHRKRLYLLGYNPIRKEVTMIFLRSPSLPPIQSSTRQRALHREGRLKRRQTAKISVIFNF